MTLLNDETRNMIADRSFQIAEHLMGPPTSRTKDGWRWGRRGSLSVEGGTFFDFERSLGGDMIKLWATQRGISIRDAIVEITSWIGAAPVSLPIQKRSRGAAQRPKGVVWPADAHSAWFNARPLTLADVAVWERRGLPVTLDQHGRVSFEIADIYWLPSTMWMRRWGCIGTVGWLPDGRKSTIHRFWPDGPPHENKKWAKGANAVGVALRVGYDRSQSGVALVSEGIENAVSASVYLAEHLGHGFDVWAAGSAGHLETFQHADCHTLYIAHDHGERGEAAMRALVDRYRKRGTEVKPMTPPRNMDWNDALLADWKPGKDATWTK
ncbi:toprim domain-containing protein [Ruegeria arenilitoris]|uniref:toprim domain-containing protein n=1 Tax=Ruegeria arenilitoris TaxID=1173585 RepID=UPI00147FCAF9|nr:toprim domain-containing protein [Ruegeria arenilitoris]